MDLTPLVRTPLPSVLLGGVLVSGVKYCTNGSFGAATTIVPKPFIEVSLFQSVLIEGFLVMLTVDLSVF